MALRAPALLITLDATRYDDYMAATLLSQLLPLTMLSDAGARACARVRERA